MLVFFFMQTLSFNNQNQTPFEQFFTNQFPGEILDLMKQATNRETYADSLRTLVSISTHYMMMQQMDQVLLMNHKTEDQ